MTRKSLKGVYMGQNMTAHVCDLEKRRSAIRALNYRYDDDLKGT